MSSPHDARPEHPTAMLLPWYLSGALKESERRAVQEHLASCADCRLELDNLKALRSPLKAALADQPIPALEVKRAVMAQIHAETERGARRPSGVNPGGGFGEGVEQWFRNLLAPRWAPMLASTLLIGQLVLLLWTAGEQTVLTPGPVTTRNLPPAATRVTLAFTPSASETHIRATIRALNGRLVDGPTADGLYTIEIPPAESGNLDAQLQKIRQQSDVIRRAERLSR